MKKNLAILTLTGLLIWGCAKVPITGRHQLNLLPASQMMEMSATEYSKFLNEHPPLPASDPRAQQVEKVGKRISAAVNTYLNQHGYKELAGEFKWTFHTVEDKTVNAWCMPGGRVVFYTGILPICEDEAGIAVVMGHEISHAVARHGNERMSQQIGIQAAGTTLDILLQKQPQLTHDLLLQSYGIGTGLGVLAFSRQDESEADQMGLVFMAMAGYDPRTAPDFWKRMAALGGDKPPEFLSTHPADDTRIKDIEAYMPKALKYYNPQN